MGENRWDRSTQSLVGYLVVVNRSPIPLLIALKRVGLDEAYNYGGLLGGIGRPAFRKRN